MSSIQQIVSLYSIANIARLSANVWVDVYSSDTPLTFDLWPFTRLLFINTTNHFNWFFFFKFCLFIWTVHNLIIVFSHFIKHIIKSNCFGLPHCKSQIKQWLFLKVYIWMTYAFEWTTRSYGSNYRVLYADTEQNIFFIIYEMLNGLNDISRSVLDSVWMFFFFHILGLYCIE